MSSELHTRIRDAAASPSRPFDFVGARRRVRRRRLVAAGSSALLAITAIAVVFVGLGGRLVVGPLIEDEHAPSGAGQAAQPSDDCVVARESVNWAIRDGTFSESEIRRLQDEAMLVCEPMHEQGTPQGTERCSNAPHLASLEAAEGIADEIVLFASCPAAEVEAGLLTGPYFALGRELAGKEVVPADLVALYIEGLTRAEIDDGYVLTRPDLTEEKITATARDGTVTVAFTSEVLTRNNVSTTSASTALIEEFSALFLQLPGVDRVRFAVDRSCEAFAAALERDGNCVEMP